ncbi:MAG: formylglycine-generating enzyme family protein [Leptolyngbya sp. SIO3F4]|nr:formylglycine-generating enzyme family protein [Leptolyngbya sp. SIO3F4]
MVSPGDPDAIAGIERLSRGGATDQPSSPAPPPKPPPAPESGSITPRAAKPLQPATKPPKPKSVPKTTIPKVRSQPSSPKSVVASVAKPKQTSTSSRQSQRQVSYSSPRTTSPYDLSTRISRRRLIQILGFTGGGVGTFFLGKALLQPEPDTSVSKNSLDATSSEPTTLVSKNSLDASPLTTKDFKLISFEVVKVNENGETVSEEINESHIFEEIVGDTTLDLVPIEGGTFWMGSSDGEGADDEKPRHEVTVQPFLMGRYEVTQAQWQEVAKLPEVDRVLESAPFAFDGEKLPVESVSWDDAMEFCKRLSVDTGREYRLPTESEWEYACRAGSETRYYFGDTLMSALANYHGVNGQTTDVGSFPANAWGLHDMHGNVWEWCLDHWHYSYEGAPTNGSAWEEGGDPSLRVRRGGSWNVGPDFFRSANRNRVARDFRNNDVGFRVVCGSSWTL